MSKMVNNKKSIKAQVFSMDMILGIIIFILLMAGLLSIFFFGKFNKPIEAYDYEMDYLYRNLERNLAQQSNNNIIFLQNSRVNETKLGYFVAEITQNRNNSVDDFVIGIIGESRGIGLDTSAYDVCMYFTDNNRNIITVNGAKYFGKVDVGTCNDIILSGNNPCGEYSEAISMFKPIFFDVGRVRYNRIIQMNLVVCKK